MSGALAVAMTATFFQRRVVAGFGYVTVAQVIMPIGLAGLITNLIWPNAALPWLSNTLILTGAAMLPLGMRRFVGQPLRPAILAVGIVVGSGTIGLAIFSFWFDAINARIVLMSAWMAALFAFAALPLSGSPSARTVRAFLWVFVLLMSVRAVYAWSAQVEATVFNSEAIFHSLTFLTVSILGVGIPFAAFLLNASVQSRGLEEARRSAEQRTSDLVKVQDIVSDTESDRHSKRQRLLLQVRQILGLRMGVVAFIEDVRYQIRVLSCDIPELGIHEGLELPLERTVCWHLLESGDALLAFHDEQSREAFIHPAYQGRRPGAYIASPIRSSEGFFGTISFSDTRALQRPFNEHQRILVQTVANWFTADLLQEEAARKAQGQLRQLETLTDSLETYVAYVDRNYVTRFINQAFRNILGQAVEQAMDRHMARVVGDRFFNRAKVHIDGALAGKPQEFEDCPEMLLGRAFRLRYVPDIDPDGQVMGFFSFADEITVFKKKEEALQAAANRDPLTGLLNRRGMDHALRDIPADTDLTLILIDLDQFKSINDTHGHDKGDQALCAIAETLTDECRRRDHAVRLGGDEFLVVLQAPIAEAGAVAERIHQSIGTVARSQSEFATLDASVAAVAAQPAAIKSALAEADAMVYKIKRSGRGQVVVQAFPA
jgi:diguanylate cyclase (GGDEF)-like protein/PAS domain S-box-containing protein